MFEIILASKSKVRKEILDKNNIDVRVEPSNVDEDVIKNNLIKEKASPEIISKNLAELKANKISSKKNNSLVLGADSVIDLEGELISKPQSREEAMKILKKLNGKKHNLISSVCISKNGTMIWNYTDKAILTMKNMNEEETLDTILHEAVHACLGLSGLGFLIDNDNFEEALVRAIENLVVPTFKREHLKFLESKTR